MTLGKQVNRQKTAEVVCKRLAPIVKNMTRAMRRSATSKLSSGRWVLTRLDLL